MARRRRGRAPRTTSLAATWRRLRAPGTGALHDAARVAAAAWVGFLIGRFGLDDPQTAVYGALTPIALLGLGQVDGRIGERVAAYGAAIVAAVVAVVVGTLTSEDTLLASLVLFAGTLVASQAGVAGPNALGLSRSVVLLLVVSAGIPAPDSAIPDRLIGVAVGGALVLAAAVLLWPERAGLDFRSRLAHAFEPMAEATAALASGASGAVVAADTATAETAVEEARPFALPQVEQPIGVSPKRAAERLLSTGGDRLGELLAEVDRSTPGRSGRALLQAVADALAATAAVLRDPGASPPDLEALERARRRHGEAAERKLADLLAAGSSGDVLARTFEDVLRMRRLAAIAVALVAEARVAAGVDQVSAVTGPGGAAGGSSAARLAGQLRVRLSPDSVLLHNGLRLGLGLAAARAVAGAFDLEHGFWVVFATLTVTRASARGTGASAVKAVLGTAAGAVLATVLLFAFESEADIYVLLIPLFAFTAFYGAALSLVVGQIGFTLLIVAIFNLVAPPQWDIGLIRLEDVVVGAVVGLVIGLAAWPRGPGAQVRGALAHAIDAGGAYTRAVARRLLGSLRPSELSPLRSEAVFTSRRAEDVLTAYFGELGDHHARLEGWVRLLELTQRLWYEASVVEELGDRGQGVCPQLAAALERAAERTDNGFQAVADALRHRDQSPPTPLSADPAAFGPESLDCAAAVSGSLDRGRLVATVHLFAARTWVTEARRELDGLRASVAALA